MALELGAPVHLAAIDAGSNALRLVIARATSPSHIEELEADRAAVRLGHRAFTRRLLSNETISRAARAFREFRHIMDRYHIAAYRAVATSAAREARNRHALLERVRRKAGIELEVISGGEEARLVCSAVQRALRGALQPRLILDLGGGSLELNFLRGGALERRIALPLGTVRLMETYHLYGSIDEDAADRLRRHILALLSSSLPSPPNLSGAVAVACGGNAESLGRLAPGAVFRGFPTMNLGLLQERIWQILPLDVAERMKAFGVRRDRAEVMGIGAVLFDTLGNWLNLRRLVVPGVGVREGLLLDLAREQYSGELASEKDRRQAEQMLAGARWFGRRLGYNAKHAEQVRALAVSLFDQLRPLHGMGSELRLVLELGGLLHDAGHFISRKGHHRHGEYLVRNCEIPGLRGWRRDMVACLVRYHNSKSEPESDHRPFGTLSSGRCRRVRRLTSLLRIAEELESNHNQGVFHVQVEIAGQVAFFRIHVQNGARIDLAGLARKAALFEKEFHLKVSFKRAQSRQEVA